MKTYTSLFIGLCVMIMIGLAAFVIAPDAIYGQSTPSMEVADDPNPVLTGSGVSITPAQPSLGGNVVITTEAYDVSGLQSVVATIKDQSSTVVATVELLDNGQNNDGEPGDGTFGITWNVGQLAEGVYPIDIELVDRLGNSTTIDNVMQFPIGAGACLVDADCAANEVCCAGSCGAAECASAVDCDDGDNSTADTCETGSCPAFCSNTPITSCITGDGYCPATCTLSTDGDCSDTTPPFVAIQDPDTDGVELTTDTYTVVAQASDTESGIDRVEFYVDSETTPRDTQIVDSPVGSGYYNWVLDVSGLSNGTHTLTARAYDMSLSADDIRTISVNISTPSAPTNVSITSPANGSTFASTNQINFAVHAEDDTDVTTIELYSTNGGGPLANVPASGTVVDILFPVVAGTITLNDNSFTNFAYSEPPAKALPFISTAHAATNSNCTTTTNYHNRSVYAVAYDDTSSTNSPTLDLIYTTTTTTCTSVNSTTTTTTSGTSGAN